MTVEEENIKKAAQEHRNNPNPTIAFISGAKSPEAKMYWLQKLSEEFESKSDDDTISIIEIVNKVLKSDMAREYHTKGLYCDDDVWKLLNKYLDYQEHGLDNMIVIEWFNLNKKK